MERIRPAIVVLLLLAVPACSDGTANEGEETTVVTIPTTTTDSEPATSTSTSTTVPSTTTSTEPTTTTTVEPLPFPPARQNLTHGGDTWVVILAASEVFDDPVLDTAVGDAEAAGYQTGPTDCDFGAADVLGLPDDRQYYTVSVYLSNQADAEAALDAFEAQGVGGTVGVVQTFCLD
jgi:hypothetical protein